MENKKCTAVQYKVRYNECDPSGYAFNANFFIWMQEAVGQFITALGIDVQKIALAQQTFMAVHLSCDYKRPVGVGDIIDVSPQVIELGESNFQTQYNIYKEGDLAAVGKTIHVFMDTREKKRLSLTDELREKLESGVQSE